MLNKENRVWLILFIIGGLFLAGRVLLSQDGMSKAYVKVVGVSAPDDPATDADESTVVLWDSYENASFAQYEAAELVDPNQTVYRLSVWRSLGVWIAASFTLFVLTFLIKDNPFYKIAESIFIGVSAAYWMVVAFWDTMVPNLIGKLSPALVRNWAMPGLGADQSPEYIYIVPLILGVMLLWRLAPKGGWISRWPMAFFIGVFCGFRLIRFLQADFLSQIRNGIVPLYGTDAAGQFDFWLSLQNIFLVVGVLACLVYFFFSIEHKGLVAHTARLGIWFLMVTFGAAFAYTVMGRIALLAIRIEFLFDDWLWLIDPRGTRAVEEIVAMLPAFGLG